jgi:hypothetical protein
MPTPTKPFREALDDLLALYKDADVDDLISDLELVAAALDENREDDETEKEEE